MQLDQVTATTHPAGEFERMATRQALRVSRMIGSIALSLAVLMWCLIAWSVWSADEAARQNGRIQAYNLTAAFANDLSMSLDAAAAELRAIAAGIKTAPPGSAPFARELRTILTPGSDVVVAAPDGRLLFSTHTPDPGSQDYSRRRHFIEHRDDPGAGILLDRPDHGKDNRIELSQRLDAADGGFGGEITLLLPPGKLLQLNREIDIGRRGMLAIAGLDGIIRAGYDRDHPDGMSAVGTDWRGSPYPENLAPGRTADYIRGGRARGVERLVTVRRLERYPVNVLVALDLDDVLGSARSHLWFVALVGIGATGLIGVLCTLLVREVGRRTRREIELSVDRDRLALAQAQIEADRARLAETNRELLASKESADAANRAKSQFLAHMSHELRTPLHAIIGFSELIKDQSPSVPGSPPIAGYARDIWTSGRHLLDLINSILDISKVESGTATLAETVFAVADLIRSSLISVRAQAQARGISIDVQQPDEKLKIWADRTRMQQVLINLLSNAVKFTPDNGRIVLTVAKSPRGELVLSVADSGIGMTEADIEIAMAPFGQVDNSLSRSFEGTGLGLPLAHRLAELHGGTLNLKSVKGHGTTATVTLPAERIR
jgi:two-component system cell cycle sensor histidine kinase PleC